METIPTTSRSLDRYYHINGDTFEKQYKEILSGYREWSELSHADEWLVFPENMGECICIDETAPSNGELYTVVTNRASVKDAARLSLARWYNKVDDSGFKSFNVIAATLYEHCDEVLNFFVNRATNAFAEPFNAKIKAFRVSLRGMTDIRFFFFRLTKLYA